LTPELLREFEGDDGVYLGSVPPRESKSAKRREGFGPVAPNLNVVNVLTPPTSVMEGFTNHLVEADYTPHIYWQQYRPSGTGSPVRVSQHRVIKQSADF